MDSTVCEIPEIDNFNDIPQRRSLFKQSLPVINPDSSTEDNVESQAERTAQFEKYLGVLTTEKENWKKIYNEIKEKNRSLKKKLKASVVQQTSFAILDKEDRDHINNQPNYVEYTEQIADLKCLLDIVKERVDQVRLQDDIRLNKMKAKITVLEEFCCD